MSAKSLIENMGITVEKAYEADRRLARRSRAKSNKICACGHPTSRHNTAANEIFCEVTKYKCHCKQLFEVIEVSDNRIFCSKTNSYGAEHALTRGLVTAFRKGIEVKELDEYKCMSCNGKKPIPALIETDLPGYPRGKLIVNHKKSPQQGVERHLLDILLCASCLDEYILGAV